MIKNKKLLYLALIPFIAFLVLNLPFPHESSFGETIASALNILIRSANGLHYVGVVSLALLITSLNLPLRRFFPVIFWKTFVFLGRIQREANHVPVPVSISSIPKSLSSDSFDFFLGV